MAKVVQTSVVRWFRASAITVWPFIFVMSDNLPSWVLKHERVHAEQQRRWALYGLGVGLLVWWALYLIALPVGWNWWRARWEREAYLAVGMPKEAIEHELHKAPYYLWWM